MFIAIKELLICIMFTVVGTIMGAGSSLLLIKLLGLWG